MIARKAYGVGVLPIPWSLIAVITPRFVVLMLGSRTLICSKGFVSGGLNQYLCIFGSKFVHKCTSKCNMQQID